MLTVMRSKVMSGGLALLMIPAVALPAFAATPNEATAPSVMVFGQKAQGQTVAVSYAHLPKDGYIVIYSSDKDGKPSGDPLGNIALKAGDHRDFKVELKSPPPPDSKLWAALYEDKDGDKKLDKSKDLSFWPGGKLPWENQFQIQ